VIFSLFTGEQWNHLGSRAFVKSLKEYSCHAPFKVASEACPYVTAACSSPCVFDASFGAIKLDRIAYLLDVNYIGRGGLRLHTTSDDLKEIIQRQVNGSRISPNNRGLPPSPALAFLEQKLDLPVAVWSTLDEQYPLNTDTDYDDHRDAINDEVIQNVCTSAQGIARTIGILATDRGSSNNNLLVANCTLVAELLNCALKGQSCPLGLKFESNARPSMYTGVATWAISPNWLAQISYRMLANATRILGRENRSCSSQNPCVASAEPGEITSCLEGQCVSSFTHYHLAYPDGLSYNEGTQKWYVSNPEKSTWVESDWDRTGFRLFYTPSLTHQLIELFTGIAILAISVLIYLLIKKRIKL
jgi:hypothetical protein